MIIRIVQMTFRAEEIEQFISFFEERKETIRSFEGCKHLELWQDAHDKHTFFTYSIWENEQFLDHYRFSEFFKDTWTITKAKFASKPQAWSVTQKSLASGNK